MVTRCLVKPSFYRDSVVLLHLSRELKGFPGVAEVGVLMGTPANKSLLDQAGLLTPGADAAGPNDLVIAVRAASADVASGALANAESFLTSGRRRLEAVVRVVPRSLDSALRHFPEVNLALISVPGACAGRETRKALRRGLHVMLFSDNVPLEEEVALKELAMSAGVLLMGPDCGTAIVNGVPLGFANAVPRGRVGVVSASGSGLQQVSSLLATMGEGISHALGVGGRDGSKAVGGAMTVMALEVLAADPATELLVVLGKPAEREVRARIEAEVRNLGKPCVLVLLDAGVQPARNGLVTTVATLEDAARAAVARLQGRAWRPVIFTAPVREVRSRVEAVRSKMAKSQTAVRGLYAGGTLAHEARLILEPLLGPIASNLAACTEISTPHQILDLGADEFTVGRAHPMIDPTFRSDQILAAGRDPALAVLLLDVVLGHGASADPSGDLAPAIAAARQEARKGGRELAVVASVVGTAGDPQGLSTQIARLEAHGVWVMPSNAQASRFAACLAGGEPVLRKLLDGE